jgi:hypothetical protein
MASCLALRRPNDIRRKAAKRWLSIHIRPYGEGVGVYIVTASGHEAAAKEASGKPVYSTIGWPRPIPVSERLPEEGADVLVFGACEWDGSEAHAIWRDAQHVRGGSFLAIENAELPITATHWMPLPPAPEATP